MPLKRILVHYRVSWANFDSVLTLVILDFELNVVFLDSAVQYVLKKNNTITIRKPKPPAFDCHFFLSPDILILI